MDFLWMLEGFRTPFLDKAMQFITYFGQEMIIIVVICALYWCADKRFAYQLGFTYFTAGLCVQALKITFRIPRPWVLDPNFQAVESAVPGATGYSFPSGHTQGATSLFMPFVFRTKKIFLKILCVAAFVLIGFSRMYLGCHTPKDVLVSMLVSIFFAWLVWRFQYYLLDDTKHLRHIALTLVVFSLLTATYSLILLKNGVIDSAYASDCCKAAGAGLGFAVGWYVERTHLNFSTKATHIGFQIAKLAIGLVIALVIKEGASFILGTSILAKMVEYFILVLWVLVIYPYIFSRMLPQNKQEHA